MNTYDSFETDTAKLWYGGVNLLPSVADEYSRLSQKVHQSRGEDAAFQLGDSVTGTMYKVYFAWNDVRDDFQDILARSSENLKRAGGGLTKLSEAATEHDNAGAREIDRAKKELENIEVHYSEPVKSTEPEPEPVPDFGDRPGF